MMTNNSAMLRRFFRGGAAIGALSLAMGAATAQTPPAAAPDAPAPVETTKPAEAAPASGEKVVITGSRIAKDVYTSSSPITVITAESAQLEGLVDTAEILQGSSIANGSVQINNQFGGFVVEGGVGINSVSLRGLGAQRSLVLLNGQRPGPSGTRGQVGAFDLNVIPDSIISRVEILKDGASSIYGSDAVAGVANVITRSSIAKPELTMQVNRPEEQGGAAFSLNGGIGFDFDWGGTLMVAAEYEKRDRLTNGDRSWSRCAQDLVFDPATGQRLDRIDRSVLANTSLGGCNSTNVYFNTILASNGQRYVPSPDGITSGPFAGYRPRANRTFANSPTGFAYFEDVLNSEKYLDADVLSGVQRASVYGKYDMDVLGMQWTTEGLFTRRETESREIRQFFPFVGGAAYYDVPGSFTSPLGAFSWTQPVTVWPLNTDVNVDYYYINSKLKGDFGDTGILSTWTWEANASYTQSEGEYIQNNILNEYAGDANYPRANGLYYGPTYNPFSADFLSGNYSSDVYNLLTSIDRGTTSYTQSVVSAVATGDIFSLPAGDVGLAVGAEYRAFEIDDTPSLNAQQRKLWGISSALPTRGEDNVSEAFVELDVPLLKGVPFIEELTFNGSARAFDYDSYGSDSVWKAGLNWQVTPSIRVRGTKGTSYRAPALYELYLGNQTSFAAQTSIDPCSDWGNSTNTNLRTNCAAAGVPSTYIASGSSAEVVTGGGKGVLSAETSEASTLGFIFTPSFINLSVAIDYFDITIFDQVAQLGAGSIVSGCYAAPVYPNAFCDLLTRAPASSARANQILTVNDSYVNVNQQATHGIDIAVRYEHEFDFGNLVVDVNATNTQEDVNRLFAPTRVSGFNTNDFNGSIGDPEWTGDAQFSLRRGDMTYSWFVDYVGETDNSVFYAETVAYQGRTARRLLRTEQYFTHDLSVRWRGDNVTVTGGVANVFNAQPPIISANVGSRLGNAPIYGTQYDLLGRTMFLRVGTQF